MKTQRKPLANGSESGAGVYQAEIMKPANLLLQILLGLLLTVPPNLPAQPVPHHFDGIAALPDRTITLSLDGSVSNMFSLSGTISSQFMQMFDLYAVEASTNLAEWTRLALLLRTNSNPNPLLFQDTNAVFLQIRGADHMTPCDAGWTVEIPQGRRPALTFDDCAVWFFDTYLKGEAPPFPTNPEIYNLQRK